MRHPKAPLFCVAAINPCSSAKWGAKATTLRSGSTIVVARMHVDAHTAKLSVICRVLLVKPRQCTERAVNRLLCAVRRYCALDSAPAYAGHLPGSRRSPAVSEWG